MFLGVLSILPNIYRKKLYRKKLREALYATQCDSSINKKGTYSRHPNGRGGHCVFIRSHRTSSPQIMDLIPMALSTGPSYWYRKRFIRSPGYCPTHLKEFGWGTQSTKENTNTHRGAMRTKKQFFSNFHRSESYILREEECECPQKWGAHCRVVDLLSLYFYPFEWVEVFWLKVRSSLSWGGACIAPVSISLRSCPFVSWSLWTLAVRVVLP